MNKKVLVLIALVFLLPLAAFSAVFQLGGTVGWNIPIDQTGEDPFSFSKIDFGNYEVGADGRVNISFIQLQGEIKGHFSKELLLEHYSYNLASSIRFDIFFFDITAGMGLNISVAKDPISNEWKYNNQNGFSASDVFSSSQFYYKAGFGIDFGPVSLEFQGYVPTGASWKSMHERKEQTVWDSISPKFDKMKVSVGILANFL